MRFTKHLKRHCIAYMALFVALGGTSYAAIRVPRNSVGSAQLRRGAVTNAKVKRGSLTPSAFAAGTLSGTQYTVRTTQFAGLPGGQTSRPTALCVRGEVAASGGYFLNETNFAAGISFDGPVIDTDHTTPIGWEIATDASGGGAVYAICVR
jgi:hypothetical protein